MISGTHAIVVGYHGCDKSLGKRILAGNNFRKFDKTTERFSSLTIG